MRVIITGTPTLDPKEMRTILEDHWQRILRVFDGVHKIITTDADGMDFAARHWAQDVQLPFDVYRIQWRRHGSRARQIVNQEMVDRADGLVLIWTRYDRDSRDIFDRALQAEPPLSVMSLHPDGKDTFNLYGKEMMNAG